VGFVFQAFHVLPYLTVEQNIALPLELLGVASAERLRRTAEMMEAVGVSALARSYARELSGGEVQRIAIARALVHKPRLVLADEPTGNLDPRSAAQILSLLRAQIQGELGRRVVDHAFSDGGGHRGPDSDTRRAGVASHGQRGMSLRLWSVLLLAQLREQPGRLLVTVLAIALGVALGNRCTS